MSCSKPLPPFTFDFLCYLNRDQLERFSIVSRPLKNFIERYFRSKPYRLFDELRTRGGSYALYHKDVQWHPNREDYNLQQFLAGQKSWLTDLVNSPWYGNKYYSFTEMRPYLVPTVRIKLTTIRLGRDSIYHLDHIVEMESIAYLWRDGNIHVYRGNPYDDDGQMTIYLDDDFDRIVAEDFQPILNSPSILQCRDLSMSHAHFSFKDHNVLYTVQVFRVTYLGGEIDPTCWPQFLEQPGVKPVVSLVHIGRADTVSILDRLCKAFSSSVLPNPFKIVFSICDEVLTEFQEINKTSAEKLELKKEIPIGYEQLDSNYNSYMLERSSI